MLTNHQDMVDMNIEYCINYIYIYIYITHICRYVQHIYIYIQYIHIYVYMYLSIRGYKNHKYQRSTDGIPILRGLKRGFFARETWRRTRLQGLGAVHLVDLCPACRRSGRASWGSQMLNLLFGWDILGNYIILIYIYTYMY